jgi:hypothetical protein
MKTTLLILLAGLVCLGACQQKPKLPDTLPFQVAKAYGFENFDQIKAISYTWNVQRDSVTTVSRQWKWNIQDSTVYYSGADTSFTYSLIADSLPKQDGAFINDKYWAMMPFQLAWDSGYTHEATENVATPIKGSNSTKLTIVYNSGEPKAPGMGYTPGDAYDLYLDENKMILEWTFRKGNAPEGRTWTWENVGQFGPIKLAQDHLGSDGNRFIWLSDVKVE